MCVCVCVCLGWWVGVCDDTRTYYYHYQYTGELGLRGDYHDAEVVAGVAIAKSRSVTRRQNWPMLRKGERIWLMIDS